MDRLFFFKTARKEKYLVRQNLDLFSPKRPNILYVCVACFELSANTSTPSSPIIFDYDGLVKYGSDSRASSDTGWNQTNPVESS